MRVVMGKLPTPQNILFDWRLCSVAMSGKTTAPFRCPCTEADAPCGHSFWVVLEGPGGWPSVLPCNRARIAKPRGCSNGYTGIANRSTSFVKVTNTINYDF